MSAPTVTTAAPSRPSTWVVVFRVLLPLVALKALIIPIWVFFSQRGGWSYLEGLDLRQFSLSVFPAIGLLAFSLLWLQFMIGATRHWLRRVFPRILSYHTTQGVFVFLLAWLHPSVRALGIGLDQYLSHLSFGVALQLVPWLWVGYVQLFLLTLTVLAGLLRRWTWLKSRWHMIHLLNYVVFILVWLHSWFLGSDVRSTELRYVWVFFGLTALGATAWRFLSRTHRAAGVATAPEPAGTWVPVARVGQVAEGSAMCATAGGQEIALFHVQGSYYALTNQCSHAGGPLCEGTIEGTTVECPLHSSRFDLRTGAVIGPPATAPQRVYPVRVVGDAIEIRLT